MILQRGKACSNCRRRKIRCNGTRPCCAQCRLLPAGAPLCEYFARDPNKVQTPRQLLQHIQTLKAQINELQRLKDGGELDELVLHHPYRSDSSDSSSSPTPEPNFRPTTAQIREPPANFISTLVNAFMEKFASSELFFLNSRTFYEMALRQLPFGHPERPSNTLLSAVYLWGCVYSTQPNAPYTEDSFLQSALQTLPKDIADFPLNPRLVVQTIQAQVLLSYYYLHSARPVEGRSHSATAVALALDAGLHTTSLPPQDVDLPFPLGQTLLAPAADDEEMAERISAFWGVLILDNYWVAVQGSPSTIPSTLRLDTHWSVGSDSSPTALLVYASTCLERIIAFSAHTWGASEPALLDSFSNRLKVFRTQLPPLPGDMTLLITHALTDLAIVRLHAPYSNTSEEIRVETLAAAARIVVSLGRCANDGTCDIPPILGALYGTICNLYVNKLGPSRTGENDGRRHAEYQEIETRLQTLMDTMASFAATSPVTRHCLTIAGQAYAFHRQIAPSTTDYDFLLYPPV
ncbi:hypothetical protein DFH09DRAFT_1166181 [Mycena vulgaris]|nr:hypothetical protein DFH09DRAFT_1166181 [Mycena vulgaris]